MTMDAVTEQPVREVPAGTLVIYTDSAGTYRYQGPADGPFAQIAMALGAAGPHGLTCDPACVAPADTPVPARDDRIVVARRERGYYPTHKGPWLLTVAGRQRDFFTTKRDATAAGLRTVAILDWHAGKIPAGPVVLPHTGMTVPHTRLSLRKLRSMPTSDGEAYTAELLVDGKPAGSIENSGQGGATIWYPHDRDVFSRTDMQAYVYACRDQNGQPMAEEFVLAELFEETRTGRDVARFLKAGKLPVRTFAVTGGDEVADAFVDAYHALPAGFGSAEMRERLTHVMWRDCPAAHAIQVWTGEQWEDLPAPDRSGPAEPDPGR